MVGSVTVRSVDIYLEHSFYRIDIWILLLGVSLRKVMTFSAQCSLCHYDIMVRECHCEEH